MKFDVMNCYSRRVQFTAIIDATESDNRAEKLRKAVFWAFDNNADLRGADLRGANLRGANLRGANLGSADLGGANLGSADLGDADLGGANLGSADLGGADLRGVNLGGASLWGVNLGGANLWGVHGINDYIKSLAIDTYSISYTSRVLQIGCERHAIEDWRGFDDRRVLQMDGKKALDWWRKYKDFIFRAIELAPSKPTKPD